MAGLVPAIHVSGAARRTWMPGTRPGMTAEHSTANDMTRRMLRLAFILLAFALSVPAHRAGAARPRQAAAAIPRAQASPRRTAWWWRRRRRAARIGVEILQSRRQCGGRRGRDRFCAGGDLSARRQYRRRRLHGDPSRRAASSNIAIDYRETAPAATTRDSFLDAIGKPTRRNRSPPASASACPARWPGLRSRTANTAPASSRWRN